jgi:hypothetical protein
VKLNSSTSSSYLRCLVTACPDIGYAALGCIVNNGEEAEVSDFQPEVPVEEKILFRPPSASKSIVHKYIIKSKKSMSFELRNKPSALQTWFYVAVVYLLLMAVRKSVDQLVKVCASNGFAHFSARTTDDSNQSSEIKTIR